VIISEAITSVYIVIAVWIPVTVVPTSLATVAIETFITELSSVIRNCAAASVISTVPEAFAVCSGAVGTVIRSLFLGPLIGSGKPTA
jgi:hypothetical protein